MGTVISFTPADWHLMRTMRENIQWYRDQRNSRWDLAITKSREIYNKTKGALARREAA